MTLALSRRAPLPRLSRFGWLMGLYAENHARLQRLFEPADLGCGRYLSTIGDGLDVHLEVVEQHAYTSELRMSYGLVDPQTGLADPSALGQEFRFGLIPQRLSSLHGRKRLIICLMGNSPCGNQPPLALQFAGGFIGVNFSLLYCRRRFGQIGSDACQPGLIVLAFQPQQCLSCLHPLAFVHQDLTYRTLDRHDKRRVTHRKNDAFSQNSRIRLNWRYLFLVCLTAIQQPPDGSSQKGSSQQCQKPVTPHPE